jgi:hypothetical protein
MYWIRRRTGNSSKQTMALKGSEQEIIKKQKSVASVKSKEDDMSERG